jgi:FKBP-type peptidyl-prolyl cis-trans isomerase
VKRSLLFNPKRSIEILNFLNQNFLESLHFKSENMGVTKQVLKAGDGIHFPKAGDTVTMHYIGTFKNGKV